MDQIRSDRWYTREHEWVQMMPSGRVRVGITDFAQQALGDIVFLELPGIGQELRAEDSMGSAESVKSVSDVYAPVNGIVTAVNPKVEETPSLLNTDPYGEGWIVELEPADGALDGLLTEAEYRAYTSEEAESDSGS
ncbi:glycine cleavage system protein GcvH [Gorillibacterium sp. sgz5001074]|uniref:glycine cleavage system protein GcvH n=1 Tax=Gorillibacterium sp. sgz5001074 TaxID=3446695 RepID=UPI003F67052F